MLKHKLNKRDVNNIAFILYKHIHDTQVIKNIIDEYSLDSLIKTYNNGIISNLLQYFINTSDNNNINYIINFNDISLMKRDYLHLIKYYYSKNINLAIAIFINFLKKDILLSKDLDYLIDNKLFAIIKYLDGLFIQTASINNLQIVNHNLKLYYLDSNINEKLINFFEEKFLLNYKKNLFNFIEKYKYDIIIDGGNVLHSKNGTIDYNSIIDLKNIICKIQKDYSNSILLVIHEKHCKKFPKLITIIKELGINYYLTPYNMNDDIFIIWFFLKTNTRAFIISNDKFKDHVFYLTKQNQYDIHQFSHIINQQTLNYDIITMIIATKPEYSKCIQVLNNNIYIPNINNYHNIIHI